MFLWCHWLLVCWLFVAENLAVDSGLYTASQMKELRLEAERDREFENSRINNQFDYD